METIIMVAIRLETSRSELAAKNDLMIKSAGNTYACKNTDQNISDPVNSTNPTNKIRSGN
jgi:hypothetical protein